MRQMSKVLITATNYELLCREGLDLLYKHGCDVEMNKMTRMYTREEMLAAVGDIDGLIAHVETWDDELFDKAPRLKVIARFGVGYDCIDLEAAKRHHVTVVNFPGINSNAVAEMTITLLMALIQDIPQLNRTAKAGTWPGTIISELSGKRVGVLGFGAIAQKTIRKLKGFGVDIIVYNRTIKKELADSLGVAITSDLDEVLSTSDYILIHLASVPETRNLIRAENIAKMKDGAYIVNTARAPLVNESDLYDALASGKLSGFATDVYNREPPDLNNPLFSLPNFIGTPHSAGETYENYRDTGLATAQTVIDVLEGRELRYKLV